MSQEDKEPEHAVVELLRQPAPAYLGGSAPKFTMPQEMDCQAFRNLMNHFYCEYLRASVVAQAEGDMLKAANLRGIAQGITLAVQQQIALERYGPDEDV